MPGSGGRVEHLPSRVLVTGATGAVGAAIVAALEERGASIVAMARNAPSKNSARDGTASDGTASDGTASDGTASDGTASDGIAWVKGDVRDHAAVERACSGADIVIHAAARLHTPGAPESLRAEYESINAGGTRVVVDAARRAGVARVVVLSTISIYGPGARGVVFDEDSAVQPAELYAETKLAAETIALESRRDDGAPLATVLRLAAVYGPRMKGNYPRLVRALRRGTFVPIGAGANRRTIVHEDDVVEAVLLASVHPAAAGRVYNVTDGGTHAFAAIVAAICAALGRHPPRARVPIAVARSLARAVDLAARAAGRRGRCRALVDKLLEDIAVDGSRIREELGFRPRRDLIDGWRRTLAPADSQTLAAKAGVLA